MADTLAVAMSATITDELNTQAPSTAYALVDPGASFATIIGAWQTFLADLDACTDGAIVAAAIHVFPTLPTGLKTAALTGARVEQTGVLNFMATGDTRRWGFAIPALSNATSVITAGKINLATGMPVPVLRDYLLSTPASTDWSNANSQPLTSFRDCLIAFRQRNRDLALATLEF